MPKTLILTTETTHHLYYLWKLSELCSIDRVIIETNTLSAPFETVHEFEQNRHEYEKNVLKSGPSLIEEILPTHRFPSINQAECKDFLEVTKPDVIIVFGTGKICAEIISIPTIACLNLHGGAPEYYRGLDSHLWAIYHNDFRNIITTLHHMEPNLDTGKIVFEQQLDMSRSNTLEKLRIVNTDACIDMSALAIRGFSEFGYVPSREQLQQGRYYSFMPKELKEICLQKFNRFLKTI